jgi:Icc-related predicted phosphoesterase
MSKLMLVGDLHANTAHALKILKIAREQDVDKIIQLGDFGYWPARIEAKGGGYVYEDGYVKALSKYLNDYTDIELYFIDGNHENHDVLDSFPRSGFKKIAERIFHVQRGHVWQWDGVTFLGLGGADSIDKHWRTPYVSWFPQELISYNDVERALTNTEIFGKIDVMFTHDSPFGVPSMGSHHDLDNDNQFPLSLANRKNLRAVVELVKPYQLFHGHFHIRYDYALTRNDGHVTFIHGLANDIDGVGSFKRTIESNYLILDTEEISAALA